MWQYKRLYVWETHMTTMNWIKRARSIVMTSDSLQREAKSGENTCTLERRVVKILKSWMYKNAYFAWVLTFLHYWQSKYFLLVKEINLICGVKVLSTWQSIFTMLSIDGAVENFMNLVILSDIQNLP